MRMSEAMRKGIEKDGYQTRRVLFTFGKDNKLVGCCALGAALIGMEENKDVEFYSYNIPIHRHPDEGKVIPHEKWPEVMKAGFFPPTSCNLSLLITTLNDRYKWTRERIADYVESIGF